MLSWPYIIHTGAYAVIITVALYVQICHTAILHIPSDYLTIQSGINASTNGDTVLVHPGIYQEKLIIQGRSIVLASKFLTTSDTSYIDSTILDGNGAGIVVTIVEVDNNSVLAGLTIRGGSDQAGAGISCSFSDLTISDNIICGNFAEIGAGIGCWFSSPTIKNNKIIDNIVTGVGAGIALWESHPTIIGNVISKNVITAVPPVYGSGIACYNSHPTIIENTISNNTGGAIGLSGSNATIRGNVITGNTSEWGGGLYCTESNPSITGNTLSGNSANIGGGILLRNSFPSAFESNIIAFSGAGEAINCADSTPAPNVVCCDIFGNAGGDWIGCIADQMGIDGNISEDPLFCDSELGSFWLQDVSPCTQTNSGCALLIGALAANCSSCCSIAGDADNSGELTIGDAVSVAKYVFAGGDEPLCLDQADADGGGDVNIGDATFIVKFIFQGGNYPVCGTTGS